MGAPQAGDWLIIRDWGLSVRQISKITAKLFKLGDGTARYPSQIEIGSHKIAAALATRAMADAVCARVESADAEYRRRERSANDERSRRLEQAKEVRDKAVARAVASAMSARSGETAGLAPQDAHPEPQSD